MNSEIDTRRKKELGAFYTHKGLTDIICSWAIRSAQDTVLEPSFGGCGFLRSARDRLLMLQSDSAPQQIFGCDIDPSAFSHLSMLFEQPVDLDRFYEGDFLAMDPPCSWPQKFDVVLGNPPYLPYRLINKAKRESALQKLTTMGLKLDRKASLWAYFIALSINYVAEGGKTAWVLPSSFLCANYSTDLRRFIASSFGRVRAFELKERQFLLEGTEEKTIVLLAAGKRPYNAKTGLDDILLEQCEGVKDLSTSINHWETNTLRVSSRCGTSVFDCLSREPKKLIRRLTDSSVCTTLGDHIRIKIGLVTGNNSFFLLNNTSRENACLSTNELANILPRIQFAPGVEFRAEDHVELVANGGKGYLVSISDATVGSEAMKSYLSQYPADEIKQCSTFKKRAIWSLTDDSNPPDAFFPVMQHWGPRIVLNSAGLNCTNTIHRAYFLNNFTKTARQLISLSILSTFSQISAEICGRTYGSGALKHEPREAEKIELLLPDIHHRKINAAYHRVDKLLRAGHFDEARQTVDYLIFSALPLEDVPAITALLRSGLSQLREHRHR